MESFKEIVFFAFGMIIAAFLIGLCAHFGSITSEMAAQRHDEIAATGRIALARRWGACDGQSISGGEVIALLRENAVRSGEIAIDIDRNAYGLPLTMNAANAASAEFFLAQLTNSISFGLRYTATVSPGFESITLVREG